MNIVPPGVGPAQPANCSYQSFFSDASNDPFSGQYANALSSYNANPDNANIASPREVSLEAESARGGARKVPTAFLLQHPDGKLHVYLQLAKYVPSFGLPPTQWDNQLFAQKGELIMNQSVQINWDPAYFGRAVGVRVATPANISTELAAADPDVRFIGPYADVAGTEVIRTRFCCYLPPKYVPLFMGSAMEPRVAWTVLRGAIIQDGTSAACLPLIRFLQAALTVSVPLLPATVPTLALAHPPTAPLADQALIEHRIAILHEDFPVLNAQAQAGQATQISVSINQLTQEYQQSRMLEEQRRIADKNKKYSALTDDATAARLCRLMQVADESQLPPLWARFANAKTKDRVYVLQTAIDTAKQTMGCNRLEFLATPALVDIVMHGKFAMFSADQPSTGLQPFIVPSGDAAELRNQQTTFFTLHGEGSSMSSHDSAMLNKLKPRAPLEGTEALDQFKRLAILILVLFGPQHILFVAYDAFVFRLSQEQAQLHRYQQDLHPVDRLLFWVRLMKRNALQLSSWFEEVNMYSGPLPAMRNFTQVFDQIRDEEVWEPRLSTALLEALKISALTTLGVPSLAGSSLSGMTADSSISGDSSIVPPRTPTGEPTDRVTNPDFLPMFIKFKQDRTKTQDVRKSIFNNEKPALPKSKITPSEDMCLAWHAKGGCNKNCKLKKDHVKYTKAAAEPLHQWCVTNWTLAAGS